MPEGQNLNELLKWFVTSAGMAFYATWLSGILSKLRNWTYEDYDSYHPYVQKAAGWVDSLSSIQMQNLSVLAFFIPVGLVYGLVHFVPTDWFAVVEPHAIALASAVLIYAAQQWLFYRNKNKED